VKEMDKMNTILIHLHPDFSQELKAILQKWNSCQNVISFLGICPKREYEVKLLTKGAIPSQETFAIAARIRTEAGFTSDERIIIFTEKRIYTNEYYQLFLDNTLERDSIPNIATISLDFIRKSITGKSYMFRAIIINILQGLAESDGFQPHHETKGCILDFCENMPDIVYCIENGLKFCQQHEDVISKKNRTYLIELAQVVNNYESIDRDDTAISKRISSLEKARLQENESGFDYDVALSFAGEDRHYAKELCKILKNYGKKVFYDKSEKHKLWGEDLYTFLYDLYRLRAKYCVIFISEHYARKTWTNHERKAAQERAFKENKTYILPIKLDNTEIPGISTTTGYLNWFDEGPKSIASILLRKLNEESI